MKQLMAYLDEHPLCLTLEYFEKLQAAAKVIDKNCVSCKLCEQVCIKDAIVVPRPHQFEDIGMSFMSYLTDGH